MDNLSLFFLVFGLNHKSPLLDNLMIFGAEYVIFLTIILMFVSTFKGSVRERKAFVLSLISIPILIILIKMLHLFFSSSRPFVDNHIIPLIAHNSDASFPSRHTSIMAAFAFAYTFFKSRWSLLFLLLTIWVGLSRVYVGVHYPIDIVGGILMGVLSGLVSLQIGKILKKTLL